MKRIITLLLALLISISAISVLGCSSDNGGGENIGSQPTYNDTDVDLIVNGVCDYKIVIPANAQYLENFAAEEFKNIFLKATGVSINIVNEDANMSLSDKIFAIGNTRLKEKAGVNITNTKKASFKVDVSDKTVIMAGIDGEGTVFAVYEYLEAQVGYKFYAADEIKVDTVTNEKVIDINLEYAPYITNIKTSSYMATEEAALRYMSTKPKWQLFWPHSHLGYLPPKEYKETHPEWYDNAVKPGAICLSNAEMAKEFAKNVVKELDASGYTSACLGQEDTWARCGCADCQASNAIYSESGTNVIFANRVAKEMERIYAERGQEGFDFELMLLAYYQNQPAPVKSDGKGGFVPLHEDLYLNEHIGVQYCPFDADCTAPLKSPKNKTIINQMDGWKVLAGDDKFEFWMYMGYFSMYSMHFVNDWFTLAEWVKTIGEYDTVQTQASTINSYIFDKMHAYVLAQLAYDVTQNVNDLIDEFIDNYYKGASEQVKEYFYAITTHMTMKKVELEARNEDLGAYCLVSQAPRLADKEVWPEVALRQWEELLASGRKTIGSSNLSEYEKELAYTRLGNEEIFPRYWLLKLYGDSYTATEYASLKEQVLFDAYQIGYDPGYVWLK